MENNGLEKCKNCGAELEAAVGNVIKCAYCSSVYHIDQPGNEATVTNENERWQGLDNVSANNTPSPDPVQANGQSDNTGCVIFVVIAILLLIIFFGVIKTNRGEGTTDGSDSTVIDTSAALISMQRQPEQLSETAELSLKKLSVISIDRELFKKLYRESAPTTDLAIHETYLNSKDSPEKKTANGLYIHMQYDDIVYTFYFATQYTTDVPLEIKNVTFLVDGKRLHYSPSFTTETLKNQTRQYSDEVIYDDKISMLLRIVKAKKVVIKFNGKKYSRQMILPKDQQDALLRQLQLYKGLLLGYGKPAK